VKKLAGIFMLCFIMAFSGCQKEQLQAPETIPEEKEMDVPEDNEAVGLPEATKEAADTEKVAEDGLEIVIPDEQDLVADYTSIEGLELEPGAHIAVVVMNPKNHYWKAVEKGMQQAIEELNQKSAYTGQDKIYLTYEGPDDAAAAETQINIIDAVLAENPQALCISAIDRNSLQAQLETAQENGIPVIILDSGVKSAELAYTVCETDNYNAGAQAAKKLCEKIGDVGVVQIVAHLQNADTSTKRENGFRDEIAENHPNVRVLDTIYEDAEESVNESLRAAFEGNPDVKGCFTTSEGTGITVLDYLARNELEEVQLVGFDAGAKQIEAIKSGKEYGVICQNPYGMGYATVVAASRAILGMENDTYIDAGYQWIDAINIDAEENQKYLYE